MSPFLPVFSSAQFHVEASRVVEICVVSVGLCGLFQLEAQKLFYAFLHA